MGLSIPEMFPVSGVRAYVGTSSVYEVYTNRELIAEIKKAQNLLSNHRFDSNYLKLWILYRCYTEIVWGTSLTSTIWSEKEKKDILSAFVDTHAGYEDEGTYAYYYTMLLEDKNISCETIISRLFSGLESKQIYELENNRLVAKVVFPNRFEALYYILLQYIVTPQIQTDGFREVAYCSHCGASYIRGHGNRTLCAKCGSGAGRQKAYRERKKGAKINASKK